MAGDQFSISTWWQPLGKLFFPGRDRIKLKSGVGILKMNKKGELRTGY
jgi:hypothetical protein